MDNLTQIERMADVTQAYVADKIEALLARHRVPMAVHDILEAILPRFQGDDAVSGLFWNWRSRVADEVRAALWNDSRFEAVERRAVQLGPFDTGDVLLFAMRPNHDEAPELIGEVESED